MELLLDALERKPNQRILDEALRSSWGDSATWKIDKLAPAARAARTRPEDDERLQQLRKNPQVQNVLEIFQGTIESVKDAAAEASPKN